ncbi:hypothetical protein HY572_05805 [Candidatus Micrarchaeota archaeon]|nr:hypothetical protein [Candidatus Micrarchaeota archaeon]
MNVPERLDRLHADVQSLLGRRLSFLDYVSRKHLQKIAYLLEKWGVDTGYSFVWHYAGPFSYDLHFDYYTHYQHETMSQPMDADKLNAFKSFFGNSLEDPDALELYASLLYVNDEFSCQFDPKKLVSILKLKKPKFTEDQVRAAIGFLKNKFS